MLPTPTVKNIDYNRVYEPSEDTFLLLDCFENESDQLKRDNNGKVPIVVEIGIGSGVITTFVKQNILPNAVMIATDINLHACKTALETASINKQSFEVCRMNLTRGIKSNIIDILIFNPPYVPSESLPKPSNLSGSGSWEDTEWLDLALLGGEDGMVVTWKLLNDLSEILTPGNGVAYVLFCARNNPERVSSIMRSRGWKVDTIITRKAGWEVLSVLKFQQVV
ncbi:uncharacterized protein PRCAT00003837001 [Priceomyces carsonii]|uniref:uncharacterized protein n=1 Tax=Priceomyces carsonii TaxID=28549 RepID=UPI002ED8FC52|nr:unnamed protein product [Priceomyces carsonii]